MSLSNTTEFIIPKKAHLDRSIDDETRLLNLSLIKNDEFFPFNHSSAQLMKCKHNNLICLKCKPIMAPNVWNELRMNEHFIDCVIKLSSDETVQFKGHRIIFSTASPYFKSIFIYNQRNRSYSVSNNNTIVASTSSCSDGKCTDDLAIIEKGDKKLEEIKLDIDAKTLKSIIEFIYTSECLIDWTNVDELLTAADRFEIISLIDKCCEFLANHIAIRNVIGMFLYSKHYSCKALYDKAHAFILKNMNKMFHESTELEHLSDTELFNLLDDDCLNVDNEEDVFDIIKMWVQQNKEKRYKSIPMLYSCVRIGLLDLKKFLPKRDMWIDSFEIPIKLPIQGAGAVPKMFRSRIPHEIMFVIAGWVNGSTSKAIEVYDFKANKWLCMNKTIKTGRAYHGVCALNGYIYVIGGFNGPEYFNTVQRYDPVTYQWEEKSCMHYRRTYLCVVVHGGKIYAIGGFNGRIRLDTLECYCPEKNQWEVKAPMKRARSDAGAASNGDYIFVAGGFNGTDILNSCEMYNVSKNEWTFFEFLNKPRSGFPVVAHENYLYALGGFSGINRLTSVERYSITEDLWIEMSDMLCPRSNFAALIFQEQIWVIGGFNGTSTVKFVEAYDPYLNVWTTRKSMFHARSGHAACILKDSPNLKMYSNNTKTLPESPCYEAIEKQNDDF